VADETVLNTVHKKSPFKIKTRYTQKTTKPVFDSLFLMANVDNVLLLLQRQAA
jgi:hypothetical protein